MDASGAPLLTLDAQPAGGGAAANRIFNVPGGARLDISGVRFVNGDATGYPVPYGGAVDVTAGGAGHTLSLTRCAFEGNKASYGGAVRASTANISNSTFSGNSADDWGGAVGASSTATISNSTFSGNSANTYDGGAVYASSTATISNSTFSGNSAYYHGGAVMAYIANISNSTFSDNSANTHNGGAVYANSTANIANSTFSGNSADDWGGAVYASSTATISNSAFSGNSANGGGGGAVYANSTANISNNAFSGNSANTYDGGAVYANSTANIANSTFSGNSANSGGAVYASSTANISNSAFSGNSANTYSGGAVYANSTANISNSAFNGNSANNSGGAVFADTLHARHLTLLNNTAGSSGQAVRVISSTAASTLHNSIVIGGNNQPQCSAAIGGAITGSHNLEGWADASGVWQASGTSCGSGSPVTVTVGTALNAIIETTLADNGGPTPTFALHPTSPAIGKADPTGGTSQMWDFAANGWTDATLDQRGYGRLPATSGRDIGAYETNALRFGPATLPDGRVGEVYPDTSVGTASGGKPGYSFSISSGSTLPSGMWLEADGTLRGTPDASAAGHHTFEVTVTDDDGRSVTLTLPLTIAPALPPPAASIPTLPAPLLLALMTALGLMGATARRRR